jgi:hypothetical protein|tara:strand:+ start:823 stop:1575 length:753 start_codon:yes stop_codon:yes gene_type:complete
MAINVNTVYQTVLLILNKEQRGYMTPTEFNSISTQVQLEVFEKYFEDMNQQIRVPQTDTDYADRVENIDEKIAIFKTFGSTNYISNNNLNYFVPSRIDSYGNNITFYRLGTVLYNNEIEVQRVDRSDFYHIDKSLLTKPSKTFPVYLYENNYLFIKPITITSDIQLDYIRKPVDVIWGFTVGSLGQYIYNSNIFDSSTEPNGSIDFELHSSEQTELILKILIYAGIVIRDPNIIQAAAQQVANDEANKKS